MYMAACGGRMYISLACCSEVLAKYCTYPVRASLKTLDPGSRSWEQKSKTVLVWALGMASCGHKVLGDAEALSA